MGITVDKGADGIATVSVDFPPVNAIPSAGWFELGEQILAAGRDPQVHVVILRADGRGFNAGVDIKEMQDFEGFDHLLAANRGCYVAFNAVYDCAVPVIAAVNGFCVGGGIGLVGNADCIVASDDAVFGLPEVDRGALGAATHLARMVPPHMLRTLYYTSRNVTAQQLHNWGTVYDVVPREQLDAAARAAKEALNHIDPVDVKSSYRLEQGFTFELNLAGVADEHRDEFVKTGKNLDTRARRDTGSERTGDKK